ncbi:general secretion pathway protein GspM [Diaphorobacter sp. HDW4A]|uniref:type II secretion system protein GspM n=1 Tax=Diaphorobacter sp. HDW4A TaxID=2714924 RepID=UPI001409E3DC|nr:type II secretion system protein GspM [Diaphorobacter sp. HDW4A]QIL81862.1 general secretion pathway protein GspM [Diaphorobacter sp. HDW4A]
MNPLSRRDWGILAVTVIVCLLPLFALGTYVSTRYTDGQDQLSRLEPRFARLLGLQASSEKMDEKIAQMEQRMSTFVYPSEVDATQAGNDAQQRVRSILSTAGLTVVSSQVLPAKMEQGFERITLSVRAEGELIHLQAALAVLPSLTPVILVDGINIQVVGLQRADKPQRLGTELKLSVLHRKPA